MRRIPANSSSTPATDYYISAPDEVEDWKKLFEDLVVETKELHGQNKVQQATIVALEKQLEASRWEIETSQTKGSRNFSKKSSRNKKHSKLEKPRARGVNTYRHLDEFNVSCKDEVEDFFIPTEVPAKLTAHSPVSINEWENHLLTRSSPVHSTGTRSQAAYASPLTLSEGVDAHAVSSYNVVRESDEIDDWLSGMALNEYDKLGFTPLIEAIITGDCEKVGYLINRGVDYEKRDRKNIRTPLLWALKEGQGTIAEFLIHNGADVNAQDLKDLSSPLHLCLLIDELRWLVDILLNVIDLEVDLKTSAGNTALFLAIVNEEEEVAEKLLHRNADPNTRNREGRYPLHVACDRGNEKIVRLLINFGANVNCTDSENTTPLFRAVRKGNEKVVDVLLQNKADLSIEDIMGKKPRDFASSPKIAKKLEDFDPSSKYWKYEIKVSELHIFTDQPPLGTGNYGTVFRGKLHGTPCAVKSLKVPNKHESSSVRYEIGLMSDIHHPNIVTFLATFYSERQGQCIVTEYIDGGPLHDYILRCHPLPWTQMLRCGMDTARGMAWLHTRNPSILHRDLHTNNILITSYGTCKVSDFGLSHIQGGYFERKQIYKRIRPPEIENKTHSYGKAADVFMFGLVLYELLTKVKASKENTNEQYLTVLEEEYDIDKYCDIKTFLSIIRSCVTQEPDKRPDFEELILLLESLDDYKKMDSSDFIVEKKQPKSYYLSDGVNSSNLYDSDGESEEVISPKMNEGVRLSIPLSLSREFEYTDEGDNAGSPEFSTNGST